MEMVPAAHLDSLDRAAKAAGIRLVYLFRQLGGEGERSLGRAGATILMRMGNPVEAELAARFIGREHRFVMHQYSVTAGSGTSRSSAATETASRRKSVNLRVYEFTVEPRELQQLPETALYLVDPQDPHAPPVRLVDCNPWMYDLPLVAPPDFLHWARVPEPRPLDQ
ncbi:type IV secretion system DNA-binding domain-containing protein [Phytohabitans suffuscus]|uniref:type IV secretion system DNA-binding domain-containing protein n=1 Tax=Phytohabitans suffuscus TaxID=624315 RepID=UPI00156752F5|nr:type IV secretion system DNA-binding domain-containing protein [Phytohabitans suffuscus]